ncbi:MAG: hypothetical protein WCI31_13660 [Prolixibacteraceae bacterium]
MSYLARKVELRTFFLKSILLLCIAVLWSGCSVESKLNRNFKGKSFSEVMAVMGAPTNIENLIGGGTLRTYQNKVMLKQTPINTGQFQYESFNSPKVLKTEITQFKVSQDMLVEEIKYSCEYSK